MPYAKGTRQITIALTDQLLAAVRDMAYDERRSLAKMVAILVDEAVASRDAERRLAKLQSKPV